MRSRRAMLALAHELGRTAPTGTVFALVGELGAGKTTFTQGLAAGLGVLDLAQVLSPTYTLVNEYPARRGLLAHLDFYRLESSASAVALGIDEQLLRSDAVLVVEWADKFPALLPPHTVWIRMSLTGPSSRRVEVSGVAKPRRS